MTQNLFKWQHFQTEFILLCLRWYLKYPLSYRMLVKMMQEQGINVTHRGLSRISDKSGNKRLSKSLFTLILKGYRG